MNAEYSSYQQIDAILRDTKSQKIAYLPVGCTEQHGPVLPLGTDTLVAKKLAIDLCAFRDGNDSAGIIYPEIAYSPSRSNASYSGSTTIAEDAFRSYCSEVCLSILHHNFTALVLICMHGPAEPSLVEIAFQLNQLQIERGKRIRPVVVLGVSEMNKVFQRWLGAFSGKHADYREFLLLYKALGTDFFRPEVMAALEAFNCRYAQTHLPDLHILGIPLEFRSVEGVIGPPLHDALQTHPQLAESVWQDLLVAFSEALDRSLASLDTLKSS